MTGERFRGVIEVESEVPYWPERYVVTDAGTYLYTWKSFARQDATPQARFVDGFAQGINRFIQEVRGDGECAALFLDSMDMIIFEIAHDLFENEVQSWFAVSFWPAAETKEWRGEYEKMDLWE